MKILFRPHRATLKESLLEVVEFNTIEDMLESLYKHYSIEYSEPIVAKDFNMSYYCYDKRIDWNTFIISLSFDKFNLPVGWFTIKY